MNNDKNSLIFRELPVHPGIRVVNLRCPLELECYPSCAWWQNGKCAFPVRENPTGQPAGSIEVQDEQD